MTQAFNLSQLANNVNTSGQLNAAAGLYNQVPVANGGTGVATVASGNLLVGAGTAAMTALAGSAAGQVVTWSGTAWAAAASAGGPAPVVTVYTSPATWTKPATVKGVKVTVVGGGGSGFSGPANGFIYPVAPAPQTNLNRAAGGGAGAGIGYFPAPTIPGPISVTVGSGGASVTAPSPAGISGNSGQSSSFGALITATGGGGAVNNTPNSLLGGGAGGAVTPSPTVFGVPGTPGATSTFMISSTNTHYLGGNAGLGMGFGGGTSPSIPNNLPTSGYGGGGAPSTVPVLGASQAGGSGVVIVEEFY